MIAYAEEANSRLLHSTRGDVPGLTAIKTQLDLMISCHEIVAKGEESEPPPCFVGSLIPLKEMSVQNIVITSERYVSVLEVVEALKSGICTANLQRSVRILYDNRLNKVTVFVLSDAGRRFWFSFDLCEILGFREGKSIGASERYDSEPVPDIEQR